MRNRTSDLRIPRSDALPLQILISSHWMWDVRLHNLIKRHLWQSGSTQTFQSKGLVPGGIDCEPRLHCLYAFLPNKTMQWVRGKMSKEKKNSPLCLLLTCAAFSSLKLTAILIIVTGVMKYFRRCWSFAFNHYLFTTRVHIVVDYIFCLYFNLLSSWCIFFFDLKSSRLLLKKNKSADPYVQSFLVQVQLNTRDTYFRHYRKRWSIAVL